MVAISPSKKCMAITGSLELRTGHFMLQIASKVDFMFLKSKRTTPWCLKTLHPLVSGIFRCHPTFVFHILMYEIVDRSMDNLSIDSDGFVWAAGPCLHPPNRAGVASLIFLTPTPTQIAFPHALTLLFKHFANPSIPSPTTAFRFSMNTGPDAARRGGEKYKVERVSARCN